MRLQHPTRVRPALSDPDERARGRDDRDSAGRPRAGDVHWRGSSVTGGRRYLLVTPCRDEAAYARRTLESVVRQTIPPALWVIVDDGSADQTPQILAEYARRYDYIRVIRREDRGQRSVGPGV